MTTATATRTAPSARPTVFPSIPFRTLTRVEWSKATDTRAARWLIAVTVFLTVAITLVPLLDTRDVDQDFRGYSGYVSTPMYFLLPIVAILTLTSEWTQRTAMATFTQEPRRLRVLSAKIVVTLVMAVLSAVLVAVVSVAGLAISDAIGRDVSLHLAPGLLAGLLLYIVASLLVGVAFGAALQNSPAAIVLSLVLPTVVGILGALTNVIKNWFDTGTTFDWLLNGRFAGHGGGIVVSALVWIAVPLLVGVWRTARREVS
jgi:ABC-2 type transport system permease protein